jgi:hypothetical protein
VNFGFVGWDAWEAGWSDRNVFALAGDRLKKLDLHVGELVEIEGRRHEGRA